jgi:hypothetical protein
MKKILMLLVTMAFLLSGTAFAAKSKVTYRAFTPNNTAKSAFLKSSDGQRKYFILEKEVSFGFDVVGPNTIKLKTRAELKPGAKSANYEIQVWEADHLIEGRKVNVIASDLKLDGRLDPIGKARTIVFKVPKGKHSYRIWAKSDQADRYYIRFYQAKKPVKKSSYSLFKPSDFHKQITLAAGKKSLTYYLIDNNGGASLEVLGPTKLRIYCRANFTKDMKGSAKFSLGLFEGGKEATQFQGMAKVSSKVHFKEMGDLMPSILHTYTFDVPAGKHVYDVRKINSASPSLAVRFKIAKASLGMIP